MPQQISGLVSKLDTAGIINSLMNVAKLPQMQLTDKKNDLSKLVTALQALNSKTASLADSAKKAADPASWATLGAKLSTDSVSASVRSNAAPTSLSFSVDKVAQSQISLSSAFGSITDLTGGASTLSLKVGDTVTEIDVSTITSPADLAAAISRSDAGVAASITSSTDGLGNQTYRLQLTGKTTGADQTFSLYAGDAAAVAGGSATEVSLVTARAAQDAQVTIWPGSAAQQSITSSSNTFKDLITGVDITVSKVSTDPVSLDVARDTEALTKLGTNLVSQLNQVLSEISSQTASKTTTNSDGTSVVTGGVLSGNTGVRMLALDLAQAGSRDVDGVSPFSIGIEMMAKDGTFVIDEAKFAAALADDPSKVQAVLSGIADRVNQVATRASDKVDGTLTSQITSTDQQISDLGTRITSWDSVLEVRRTALERQWASLETALSKLNSQSSWLTSMESSLSSLSSSSSSKS